MEFVKGSAVSDIQILYYDQCIGPNKNLLSQSKSHQKRTWEPHSPGLIQDLLKKKSSFPDKGNQGA